MHAHRTLGFSKIGIFLIVLVSILLIAGGVAGAYFYTMKTQTDSASVFIDTFTDKLEKGDIAATYEAFDPSLKTDADVAYYSWVAWSSAFPQNNISVVVPADSTAFTDNSVGAVLGKTSDIKFTLNTSVDSKIYLTVKPKDSSWTVVDYGTAE